MSDAAAGTPDAPRRLMIRRFDLFLRRLDEARRPLTRRESFHLRSFLDRLGRGEWMDAADALRCAEQGVAVPEQFAHLTATNDVLTTAELRQLLTTSERRT